MNIVIYTNILTPYRKHFYDALANDCQKHGDTFHVILMAETEPNRNWHYDDFKSDYTILLDSKTFTIGNAYIHINRNLNRILRQIKPDVIICAGSYLCPGIWNILHWKKQSGYKVYYWSESHLNEERHYSKAITALRELMRKTLYKKFDGFWYAGKLSMEFIKKYARNDAKYIFVPNLVEEGRYSLAIYRDEESNRKFRECMHINNDNKIIICPARLSAVKGIDIILPLLDRSKFRGRITLLITGEGEQRTLLVNMIKKCHFDVRLLGYKSQSEMIELYRQSDLFLLPSISDSNPLTCIEALWAGLPLLISCHCGNYPEVVQERKNGFVFDYCDSEKVVSIIDKIMSMNTQWFLDAGRLSRKIAEQKYNSFENATRILSEYRS